MENDVKKSEDTKVIGIIQLLKQYGVSAEWGSSGVELVGEGLPRLPPEAKRLLSKNLTIVESFLRRCREWKWTGTLHVIEPYPGAFEDHPSNSIRWRYLADPEWRPVPRQGTEGR